MNVIHSWETWLIWHALIIGLPVCIIGCLATWKRRKLKREQEARLSEYRRVI